MDEYDGFRLLPLPILQRYNGVGGKGIDAMINQWIAKHDELPALPTGRRLLFFYCGISGASESIVDKNIQGLRMAFREVKQAHLFTMEAVVILPDHLHCIWTLPLGDDDLSTRWQQIKAAFSRQLPKTERRSKSRMKKGERGIWQRRFWEHGIRDEMDYQRHVDYIHYNPVKHGYVRRVEDWRYSSFHRFVRRGVYPIGWAGLGVQEMECALETMYRFYYYRQHFII